MSSDDPIRNIMSLVDENRDSLPEGTYLELCDNIKRLYALGGETQKVYLLNLTNDYLQALEKVETLQQELVNMKRELLRSRVSRFENISSPPLQLRSRCIADPDEQVMHIALAPPQASPPLHLRSCSRWGSSFSRSTISIFLRAAAQATG